MQINENEFTMKENQNNGDKSKDNQMISDQSLLENQSDTNGFLQMLIIHPDSKWKSIFDVFVLLLVAYSCIYSILNVTFPIQQSDQLLVVYWVVETFFYMDFLLSFFQGYRDLEEQKIV